MAISEVESRLNSHEEVCALRYETINARLKRLEGIMLKTAGVLITGMAAIVWATIHVR
jgi:hypothetical protein